VRRTFAFSWYFLLFLINRECSIALKIHFPLTNIVIIVRYVFLCIILTFSVSCGPSGRFLYDAFTFKLNRSSLRFGLRVLKFLQYRIIISKSPKKLEIFIIISCSLAGSDLGLTGTRLRFIGNRIGVASVWVGLVRTGLILVIVNYVL
jgi:hypothetical protein